MPQRNTAKAVAPNVKAGRRESLTFEGLRWRREWRIIVNVMFWFIHWCKHRVTNASEHDELRDSNKAQTACSSQTTGGLITWAPSPLSCPAMSRQKNRTADSRASPEGEAKWHQAVTVTHCCWQGEDEHLSLKSREQVFFFFFLAASKCQR